MHTVLCLNFAKFLNCVCLRVFTEATIMYEFLEDKNVMVAFSFSGNPFINLNEE